MAKIVYNKILPPSGYKCINLFGILFVRSGCTMSNEDINHEMIHTAQMKELWYIPFYVLYVVFFLWQWAKLKSWDDAYKAIPFEQEAYANEDNLDYLSERQKFYWQAYM